MAFYTNDSLKAKLKQQGFRLTPQRQTILQIFQTLPQGQHLSAEELHRLLEEKKQAISLATIYRTLKLMARMGILRELELAEGHKHYDLLPNTTTTWFAFSVIRPLSLPMKRCQKLVESKQKSLNIKCWIVR